MLAADLGAELMHTVLCQPSATHVRDRVEVGGVRVGAPRHLLPRADDGVVQLPQPRQVLVVHDLCGRWLAEVSVAMFVGTQIKAYCITHKRRAILK